MVLMFVILPSSITQSLQQQQSPSSSSSSKLPIRVVVPKTPKDFQQISSLLVNVFDKPGGETWVEKIGWWFVEQFVTERDIRDQYWNTAKQMKGNKYTVLLAKVNSEVVGMAELGISQHLGVQQQKEKVDLNNEEKTAITTTNTYPDNNNNSNNNNDDVLVGATIGVLAVLPMYQKKGVGNLLLQKCEELAVCEAWNQDVLYAEVEPTNHVALNFFRRKGYIQEGRMVPVTVRRKRVYEERPHLLLYKNLTKSTS
mmetsp:Transcript_1200/g.1642  ORF Transcript_1200/g.1642 Transcript_1200/m.1642 type:complete len:255 (+) Transcript_1200:1-765(+)